MEVCSNMMKRVCIAAVTAALVATAAAGCGSSAGTAQNVQETSHPADLAVSDDDTTTQQSAEADTADTDTQVSADANGDGKVIVGFIASDNDTGVSAQLNEGIRDMLDRLQRNGIIDDWSGMLVSGNDTAVEEQLAKQCIKDKSDWVIFRPSMYEESDAAAVLMHDKGIQVIEVGAVTQNAAENACLYIGPDDEQVGKMIGEYLMSGSSSGNYIHLTEHTGSAAQVLRQQGLEKALKGQTGYTDAGSYKAEGDDEHARNAVANAVALNGNDLDFIICDNNVMAAAAAEELASIGRNGCIVTGVGSQEDIQDLLADGQITCTVDISVQQQLEKLEEVFTGAAEGRTAAADPAITLSMASSDTVYSDTTRTADKGSTGNSQTAAQAAAAASNNTQVTDQASAGQTGTEESTGADTAAAQAAAEQTAAAQAAAAQAAAAQAQAPGDGAAGQSSQTAEGDAAAQAAAAQAAAAQAAAAQAAAAQAAAAQAAAAQAAAAQAAAAQAAAAQAAAQAAAASSGQ